MSWSTAAKGAGVLGIGISGFATAAVSPVPMIVLGAVALLVIGPVAIVVLTATLSCHPTRRANATAVLDRLIVAITANYRQRPDLVSTMAAPRADTTRTPAVPRRTRPRRPRRQTR